MDAEKTLVRRDIRAMLRQLTSKDMIDASLQVFTAIEMSDVFVNCRHILLYNALPDELPTARLLSRWSKDKSLYLPRIDGEYLDVVSAQGQIIVNNPYGIGEPVGPAVNPNLIDFAIVPGLAFDLDCHRMGRGKGFYDRLLPLLSSAKKVGVCHDRQLLNNLPVEKHDVPVDAVVTPTRTIGTL